MEIILMEDVPKLGSIGDLVTVKPGYARNYLFPQTLAIPASTKNVRRLEHEKRLANYKLAQAQSGADALSKKIQETPVTIGRKVGDQDKLFGSVTTLDIERALEAAGIEIDRRSILLKDPIKELGDYEISIRLHKHVEATLKVSVVAE